MISHVIHQKPGHKPGHPHRAQIDFPPLYVTPSAEEIHTREHLIETADNFLTLWLGRCEAGLNNVVPPTAGPSAGYAWMALAGNMVWAFAPLVPEILPIEISATAANGIGVAGAFANSAAGVASVYETPDPTPANVLALKDEISIRLAKRRDRIDTIALAQRAYDDLIKKRGLIGVSNEAKRRAALWDLMFGVPYEEGAAGIQARAKAAALRVAAAGVQYSGQYEAEIQKRAIAAAMENKELYPEGTYGYGKIGIQPPNPASWEPRLRAVMPFPLWLEWRGVYRNLAKDFGIQ